MAGSWKRGSLVVGLVIGLATGAAQAESQPAFGRITAKAAILIDDTSGAVLFARNPNLPLPPASTTKIVTALVAARRGGLDRAVRVSPYASSMEPSKIWLKPGWSMNMNDLLYAVLLNSANDASVALAEGIAGSVPTFARLMNETARALGATSSNFVNPNGLPDPDHYSTVHDLAMMMHHTVRMPLLRQVLSTPSTVIRPRQGSTRRIGLRSHNRLLSRRDMQAMGKTGYTRAAKRCYVGAASDGQREVLVAVLGSTDLWGDVTRLIEYGLKQPATLQGWQETKWQPAPSAPADWKAAKGTDDDWEEARAAAEPAWQDATVHKPKPRELKIAAAPPAQLQKPPVEQDELAGQRAGLRYHIHMASFRSRAKADELRRKVAQRGYQAAVESLGGKKRPVFRVTVRNFTSRESARAAANVLRKAFRVDPLIVAARA